MYFAVFSVYFADFGGVWGWYNTGFSVFFVLRGVCMLGV